jgi:hypothetical protein
MLMLYTARGSSFKEADKIKGADKDKFSRLLQAVVLTTGWRLALARASRRWALSAGESMGGVAKAPFL